VNNTSLHPVQVLHPVDLRRGFKGFPALALLLLSLALSWQVRAEHFDFTLTVEGAAGRVEAHSDDDPPAEGLNPRPVFHGKVGEVLYWQFFMTDAKPHDPFPRLKVRYYLIPQARAGERPAAGSKETPLLEGEFTLDMKFKNRVGLRQRFHVDRPGRYLLRVETANSHGDHEHFSAADLEIK
jgi:hypothetical protein